jgi:hypothetical protein
VQYAYVQDIPLPQAVKRRKRPLKTVAFIAGKSQNLADKKNLHFFIDNLIANINLLAKIEFWMLSHF